jgi:hypothetical protein
VSRVGLVMSVHSRLLGGVFKHLTLGKSRDVTGLGDGLDRSTYMEKVRRWATGHRVPERIYVRQARLGVV